MSVERWYYPRSTALTIRHICIPTLAQMVHAWPRHFVQSAQHPCPVLSLCILILSHASSRGIPDFSEGSYCFQHHNHSSIIVSDVDRVGPSGDMCLSAGKFTGHPCPLFGDFETCGRCSCPGETAAWASCVSIGQKTVSRSPK